MGSDTVEMNLWKLACIIIQVTQLRRNRIPCVCVVLFSFLTFRWPCIVLNSYNKTKLDALISQIYFSNKTPLVSDSSSVHHQQFFTLHTAMVYVIQVCWQLASRIRREPVPSWSWHIPFLCVQWNTPDDRQRNCPEHVEFYSKNKFEKLVHLVGFIINIYVFLLTVKMFD